MCDFNQLGWWGVLTSLVDMCLSLLEFLWYMLLLMCLSMDWCQTFLVNFPKCCKMSEKSKIRKVGVFIEKSRKWKLGTRLKIGWRINSVVRWSCISSLHREGGGQQNQSYLGGTVTMARTKCDATPWYRRPKFGSAPGRSHTTARVAEVAFVWLRVGSESAVWRVWAVR